MKKMLTLLLVLCLLCAAAAGCADGKNDAQTESYFTTEPNSSRGVPVGPDDAALSAENESAGGRESSARAGGADVDLTALSSTMVFAEVYNMMASPDDYVGQTVKMSGPYYAQYYEETEQYYHYVIIEDATACCQQGLEFVWNGDHSYPDDYPADETRIEVTGVFDSYEELDMTYYHLVVDDVTVL